jgi:hypothetical protein
MIINTHDVKHIYVATRFVDMRKSIDGLSVIVSMEFDLAVLEGAYLFSSIKREIELRYSTMNRVASGYCSNAWNR